MASDERRDLLEKTFDRPACERLARSEQSYYRTHGQQYVPPLAELLNLTRADLAAAHEALREELRVKMIEVRTTESNDTFNDGFHNGLLYVIQRLDALDAARGGER